MERRTFQELSSIERTLVEKAIEIRKRAYAPYSNYKVGAALVDLNGTIHQGCNVEGADYTLTTHAEMDAINSMIRTGVMRLKAMAVVVMSDVGYGMPCGLCRQKIREFAAGSDIEIIGVNLDKTESIRDIFVSKLSELLPYSFGPEFLE